MSSKIKNIDGQNKSSPEYKKMGGGGSNLIQQFIPSKQTSITTLRNVLEKEKSKRKRIERQLKKN